MSIKKISERYTWSNNPWMRLVLQTRKVRAVRVGLFLWYKAGRVRHRRLSVSTRDVVTVFGGGHNEAVRGLRDLEAHGLIRIQWRPRHASIVTLPSDWEIQKLVDEQAARAEAWIFEQEEAIA